MNETNRVPLSSEIREKLLTYQENEITEHHIYKKLAQAIESPENTRILEEIADDELRHYYDWREYTQQDVKPDRWRIWKYYLLLDNYYLCLVCALAIAISIIAFFNYYVSVAKDEPFRERFLEMAGLSFGVAAFSFLIGFAIRQFLGIDV